MNKKTKSYILFIYDFFIGDREHLPHVIPLRLMPLSEGDMKFVYGDYGMICHIESKYTFKKIKKLVRKSLRGEVDQYFLLKKPQEFVVYMPGDMVKGLFGLHNDIETAGWKPKKEQMDKMFDKIMEEVYGENEHMKLNEQPSLDQILDKISKSGLKSLSDFEQEILKKYSKK